MKIQSFIFLLVISVFFIACDNQTQTKEELSSEVIPELKIIRFGRIAHTDPEALIIQYAPLMEYLTKVTGVDRVDLKLYNSYDKILSELENSRIDIGWLGTSFYASLKQSNFEPFVRPVWKGRVTYQGQILTRVDSNIKSIQDVKNTKFAFVSKNSTSGFVFPKMMLERKNIQLSDLREYAFLKKHDAVVFAILSRQFQVGASYVGVLDLPAY
ncbi:phosphate/phosphite/phosphonate ABC transporter substrate-binding protein, partial [bacterium]|nr:phosphate/phosphite/phosphonate ABC transporter substrate-binding protein [bacterium]